MKRFLTLMFTLALFSSVFTVRAAEIDTGQRFVKENTEKISTDCVFVSPATEAVFVNHDLAVTQDVMRPQRKSDYNYTTIAGTATEPNHTDIRHEDPGWCRFEKLNDNKETLPAGQ